MPKSSKPPRKRTAFTLVLMFIWLALLSFAIIAATDPQWLRDLSHLGRKDEAAGMKDYGDNYLRQKNYPLAIAQFEKALKIKSDYVGAMVDMAVAYDLLGNSGKSLNILQNALKLDSTRRQMIYFDMAKIYERQGNKFQAVDYYLKSFGGEVYSDVIYRKLGALYYDDKHLDSARTTLEIALQIQTNIKTPYRHMLRSSIALFEEDTTNLPIIKKMLFEDTSIAILNNFDIKTIEKIQESDPEVAKTHNYLGVIYVKQGDLETARTHFERSLQIWPNNSDALKNLQLIQQVKKNPALFEKVRAS